MAQKWSERHLGKPARGGIENMSKTTGFVPADLGTTIAFGRGLAPKTGKEGEVLLVGATGAGKQFLGVSAYSEEATVFSKNHTGPTAKNAVYPTAYQKGDVVGIVDRGSVIVKVDSSSKGIQAGDQICVLKNGVFDAYKNLTVSAVSGAKEGILINATAESDGKADECISIQLYGAGGTAFKYD